MSTALTFDTLMFFQKLEGAGFTRPQAEALAEAQKAVISEALDTQIATKGDIAKLRDEIVHLDRRMDATDAKLDKLTWMMGMLIALAVANFAKQYF